MEGAFIPPLTRGGLPGVVGIFDGVAESIVAGVRFSLPTGLGSAGSFRVEEGALRNRPFPRAPVATVFGAAVKRGWGFMGVPAARRAILLGLRVSAAVAGSSFWRLTGLGLSSSSLSLSADMRGSWVLTGLGETGISRSVGTAWDFERLIPLGAISGVWTAFFGVISAGGWGGFKGLGVVRFAA